MDQLPDKLLALPAFDSADTLLVLREMLRPRAGSNTAPEIRFLALLAIRNPSGLRQADVEQLAAAMIAWGERHLRPADVEASEPYPAAIPCSASAKLMDTMDGMKLGSAAMVSGL